ncbi:MAG: metallophosphoesterase [Candidatus Acidiferrum sp.]
MPDPGRLRNTLLRAIAAFRATPGRRGRIIELTGATEILATGDLHGNIENFRLILKTADLSNHPARHLVLQELIHGPHRYPGGGDKSHQLVDLLAALKCQFPNQVHFLLGNHELAQLTDRKVGKEEDDLNERFREGVTEAYFSAGRDIYDLYCRLFAIVPLALRTPNRVLLTHSLPSISAMERFDPKVLEREASEPADLLPLGSVYSVVWGRDAREAAARAFLARMDADWLITGHIPCDRGFDVPNTRQLVLDCVKSPACYCLFTAAQSLTQSTLVDSVHSLS